MNNLSSDGEGKGHRDPEAMHATCCQPTAGKSRCCNPQGGSWGKGKTLISLIVITAAIGVGAHSLVRGASTQNELSKPASNCSPQCGAASGQSPVSKPPVCPAQCPTIASQPEATKPVASSPTQCGAASCPNSGVKGALTQSTASTSPPSLASKQITIFGKQSCPFTIKAREAKSKEGLAVIYKDVINNPQAMEEMLRLTNGNRTVPVLVEGGRVSIGFGGS